MTSTLIYFILALLLVVTFHEFGHFLVARCFGVKVLRFSFGFGRVLASFTSKKGTEYAWSLLPFGGYVKMLDENEGDVAPEDRPFAFNRQTLSKRILIVLAGPMFNFIFAFFALWLVAIIGTKSLAPIIKQVKPNSVAAHAGIRPNSEVIRLDGETVHSWREFQFLLMPHIGSDSSVEIQIKDLDTNQISTHQLPLSRWEIEPRKPSLLHSLGIKPFIPTIIPIVANAPSDMPAAKAGIKVKDKIVAINGHPIKGWEEMVNYVQARPNQVLRVKVNRGNEFKTFSVKTNIKERNGELIGVLGIQASTGQWPVEYIRVHKEKPLAGVLQALGQTWHLSATTLALVGRLITGKLSLETISGPFGIASGAGSSGRSGLAHYLFFLALINVSLGILNLLPIPLLDGGHLFFYVIEGIIGRPLPQSFQVVMTYFGLGFLCLLMGVAVANDLARIFS